MAKADVCPILQCEPKVKKDGKEYPPKAKSPWLPSPSGGSSLTREPGVPSSPPGIELPSAQLQLRSTQRQHPSAQLLEKLWGLLQSAQTRRFDHVSDSVSSCDFEVSFGECLGVWWMRLQVGWVLWDLWTGSDYWAWTWDFQWNLLQSVVRYDIDGLCRVRRRTDLK